MSRFAQTYLQLHHQIRRLGYSKDDIEYCRRVYEFAMQVFSGYVQGNGKSFLSHGVGTASILACSKFPIQVIAAGLLHNGYAEADFVDGKKGSTPAHQKTILRVVGQETEAYLVAFHTLGWDPDLFASIRDQLMGSDSVKQTAVLLYLADHLEHNLDHGNLHLDDEYGAWRRKNYEVLVEMTVIFGCPELGNEIQRVHGEHVGIQIPTHFKPTHKPALKRKLVPNSCRMRHVLQLKKWGGSWFQWLRQTTVSLFGEIHPTLKTVRNWFLPI